MEKRTKLQAIIFDFNGVIVDDEPLHLELFRAMLEEEGIALTDKDYRKKYLGLDDRGCFITAFTSAGRGAQIKDNGYLQSLIERKAALYMSAIEERYLLFPGIVELIRRLALQYPLAIASGALRNEIEITLQRGGIRNCFRAIIAAEDVIACKPDPEGYAKALAALNETSPAVIRAEECLAVEDSVAGIQAAKRAGMQCLAVTGSYTAAELKQADWIVESLVDCDPEEFFKAP